MMNDNINSNKIKENKYKILRMSLLLGNGEDRSETINNFEDASREIDFMNDEIYLKNIEKKFYDTLTLEEEEKKLKNLVDYIGGRVEQRLSLLNDFSNITGYELSHLPPIKYYDRLEEYKERLSYITEYLNNTNKINKYKEEINDLESKLNKAYLNKANDEEKNIKEEKEILKRFDIIKNNIPNLKNITLEKIEEKINEVEKEAEDNKKSLDIFKNSYNTLSQAGISEEEKQEYKSYVEGAKEVYYDSKEIEYLLKLYILFNTTESEYNNIITKRNNINSLLSERLNLRKELNINNIDKLSSIYDIIETQYNDIKSQQDNIENIEKYTEEINENKEKVEQLETDNKKPEIISLLKEFCIIDPTEEKNNDLSLDNIEAKIASEVQKEEENKDTTEDTIDENTFSFDIPEEASKEEIDKNKINTEPQEEKEDEVEQEEENKNIPKQATTEEEITEEKEEPVIEKHEDNEVVSVSDATKINITKAIEKSNNVMKRVGDMLGVKIEVSPETVKKEEETEPTKEEENKEITEENIFTTTYDADPEDKIYNTNQVPSTETVNPLFNNTLANSTLDEVMANNKQEDATDNNDFWISNEESPLDLNSLPDLKQEDNQENSNNIEDLKFPDLDFTNMEEK